MASTAVLKALGLNIEPNQLDVQPGSLVTASNVVIRRDGVVEPRRGYFLYGDDMGTSTDVAKQLAVYKERIIRHFSDDLEFDDGEGGFTAFSGTFLEAQTGRRIRFIESNGNFYFTTSDGIKRISAASASDLDSVTITSAGGIKALDVTARLNITEGNQSGFLPQDSAVAYRVVWGYTDANKNLILGSPSQRAVIYNPLLNLEILDFNRLLVALDYVSNTTPASLITDANYFSTLKLTATSSASNLRTNLISLAAKLDADILYANDSGVGAPLTIASGAISTGVATITFSSGDPRNYVSSGSRINLAGFVTGAGSINGPQIVASTSATTITFTTTATGAVTITGGTIKSYEYEFLTVPTAPSLPATDAELVDIQTYLSDFITRLQTEPSAVIATGAQTSFIAPLDITTTVNTSLKFTVPQGVTTNNFYQLYRSDTAQATGTQVIATDIVPNDELKLVYEAYPSSTDISNGYIIVDDVTPPEFAGAFLYTDETNGEGILQANDLPPFALDIAKFKNYIFYANTKTRHRLSISLLGVEEMISDYGLGTTPVLTIANVSTTNTYSFVTGVQEVIKIDTVADVAGNLAGKYFTFNSANNNTQYYVWYKVAGVGSDPAVSGKTGILVYLNTGETANNVASKTGNAIAVIIDDFSVSVSTNHINITNVDEGPCTAPTAGTSGFTASVTTPGRGEDTSSKQILLSDVASPAEAVDLTARSIVHVINSNASEVVYAYYLSGSNDVPGKILLEARSLTSNPFYILGNNANTGSSFNPDISPDFTISAISLANPTVVTTSSPHGLINQNQILVTNSNSTPSVNGIYTITYISTTTFSIPVNVTIAGTRGALIKLTNAVASDNEVLLNRIYYSKLLQPDAVPLVNTIDVGAKDKAILRIFPLRDSLFVYKEDGLFRISGENPEFNLALFDSSCILIAPDSLDVSNNLLYGWTTQGIVSTSEAGVNIISRPIDVDILKLATEQYTNFDSATWGIGYESDNSYTVYTVQSTDDVYSTIGYRYSTLTNTWTTFDKTATCGVINPANDRQYLGAGDVNFLEQERKNFDRLDYSDRELSETLQAGNYFGDEIKFSVVSDLDVGDVLVQDQWMTVFGYNNLLSKLDTDVLLSPHNYVSSLTMAGGDDPRTKLDALITKIAADPGRVAQPGFTAASSYNAYKSINTTLTITSIAAGNPTVITTSLAHGLQTGRRVTIASSNSTPSVNGEHSVTVLTATTFSIPVSVQVVGTTASATIDNNDFLDIKTSYNGVITLLNNDPGLGYSNYMSISNDTIQEAIITNVDALNHRITLNDTLDFVVGPITVYKSIPSEIQWAPATFGDPLNLKHVREATVMFENRAFTSAELSFSSDLLPVFQAVPFVGTSNGIFGYSNFGFNFFGGASNAAPFRTYVPRSCMRCRFLNIKFNHHTAREKYSIFGVTLTGEVGESNRAYR